MNTDVPEDVSVCFAQGALPGQTAVDYLAEGIYVLFRDKTDKCIRETDAQVHAESFHFSS